MCLFYATEIWYTHEYHFFFFLKVNVQYCTTKPSYKSKSLCQWSYLQISFRDLLDIIKKSQSRAEQPTTA